MIGGGAVGVRGNHSTGNGKQVYYWVSSENRPKQTNRNGNPSSQMSGAIRWEGGRCCAAWTSAMWGRQAFLFFCSARRSHPFWTSWRCFRFQCKNHPGEFACNYELSQRSRRPLLHGSRHFSQNVLWVILEEQVPVTAACMKLVIRDGAAAAADIKTNQQAFVFRRRESIKVRKIQGWTKKTCAHCM